MKLMPVVLTVAVASGVISAQAYEAGDMIVKAGVVSVMPKSDNLKNDLGTIEVQSDTQLGLTFTYMLKPQVGIEVLAATPFKHSVELDGNKVATTKHLPPTVTAQYYPMSPESKFQPYIGAGVNMTFFFEEEGVAKGDSLGPLTDSVGLALTAGGSYQLDDQISANLSLWYMDIDTELDGYSGDNTIEIDPVVAMASIGYQF